MRGFTETLERWLSRLWLCLLAASANPCAAAEYRSDFTIHYESGDLQGATFTGRLIYRFTLGEPVLMEDILAFQVTRPDGLASDLSPDLVRTSIPRRNDIPSLKKSFFLFETLSEDRMGVPIIATLEINQSRVRTKVQFGPAIVQSSSGRIEFDPPEEVEATRLTIQYAPGSDEIILEWTTGAGIEMGPTLSGPWTEISNPISPLHIPIDEARGLFFRPN